MKKMNFTLLIIALLWIASCQSKNEESDNHYPPLKGTVWKLTGIYDTQSNSLIKILKPVDCEECYTLTFDTDHTAIVHSINDSFKLDLKNLDPHKDLVDMLVCERYHKDGELYCDSDTFCGTIARTASCHATSDSLKLFCYNKTNYLLFKHIKQ